VSVRNTVIAIIALLVIVLLVGFGFSWFNAEDQALPIIPEDELVAPEGEREVVPVPEGVEQVEPTPPDDTPATPQ